MSRDIENYKKKCELSLIKESPKQLVKTSQKLRQAQTISRNEGKNKYNTKKVETLEQLTFKQLSENHVIEKPIDPNESMRKVIEKVNPGLGLGLGLGVINVYNKEQ